MEDLMRVEVCCPKCYSESNSPVCHYRVSKMGATFVANLHWHNDSERLFHLKSVTQPVVIDGIRMRVHSVVVHLEHPDPGHFVTVVDISGRGDQWITLDDDKVIGPTYQPNVSNGMYSSTSRQRPYLLFLVPES